MREDTSFLLNCREAAKTCTDRLTAKLLKDAADQVDFWLRQLNDLATIERMMRLQCAWSRAQRLLWRAEKDQGGDGGPGGAMPVPEQQRAAA